MLEVAFQNSSSTRSNDSQMLECNQDTNSDKSGYFCSDLNNSVSEEINSQNPNQIVLFSDEKSLVQNIICNDEIEIANADQKNKKSKSCRVDMTSSTCFIIVVKYYYYMNPEVTVNDVLKLQSLNRKCYNMLIPMAMQQFNILPKPSPCSLACFEPDIQQIIEEKKLSGIKLKQGRFLTIQMNGIFRNFQKAQ